MNAILTFPHVHARSPNFYQLATPHMRVVLEPQEITGSRSHLGELS